MQTETRVGAVDALQKSSDVRLWHKEEGHVVIVTLSLQLPLWSNHLQVTGAGRLRGAAARFDRWIYASLALSAPRTLVHGSEYF